MIGNARAEQAFQLQANPESSAIEGSGSEACFQLQEFNRQNVQKGFDAQARILRVDAAVRKRPVVTDL
jgi:hypothetical protein